MTKQKKPHTKKYTLTLTEREAVRLGLYADRCGISRPQALQRLMKQAFRDLGSMPDCERDEKQLGLFDTLQIDIFNNTAVVNNKE
ncbi:MAG: hypothetical protein IJ634_05280 [Bacteroidales bacterium]|nr:hypothetical protein [Bacteroidales bacterium]